MKHTKKIICLLAALIMILATTAISFAAESGTGTVTYKGQAQKFLFEPGSEYSKTDLFTDAFKGVMPGDVLEDKITVKNEASNEVNVELLMRALGATDLVNPDDGNYDVTQQESAEFLQWITITVIHENGTVLFQDTADKASEWKSLGMFNSGSTATLTVQMEVDKEKVDDDFQQAIGALDWQFKVVETPVPQTGDDSNMIVPLSLMGIAALAIILALAGRRRKQEQ